MQIKLHTLLLKVKFEQNPTLMGLLVNTGTAKIAESSPDDYWGTGIHLYARDAMDMCFWSNQGGLMSEIYDRVCAELR